MCKVQTFIYADSVPHKGVFSQKPNTNADYLYKKIWRDSLLTDSPIFETYFETYTCSFK